MAQRIPATIVPGHRVASGQNGDPRFPGGTIRMQLPHFASLGLDLSEYHPATVNVSIAPWHYVIAAPRMTCRDVRWHPSEPAEDFSFFDLALQTATGTLAHGFIYYPHPATKPEHFQQTDVLELLLPWIEGLRYGNHVTLAVPAGQMRFEQ